MDKVHNYKNKSDNKQSLLIIAENKRKRTKAKNELKNTIRKIAYKENPLMAAIAKGYY